MTYLAVLGYVGACAFLRNFLPTLIAGAVAVLGAFFSFSGWAAWMAIGGGMLAALGMLPYPPSRARLLYEPEIFAQFWQIPYFLGVVLTLIGAVKGIFSLF